MPTGRPDCSYKGGDPGFVRVLDEHTLAFPNYDGNGMFRSHGEHARQPQRRDCSSSTSSERPSRAPRQRHREHRPRRPAAGDVSRAPVRRPRAVRGLSELPPLHPPSGARRALALRAARRGRTRSRGGSGPTGLATSCRAPRRRPSAPDSAEARSSAVTPAAASRQPTIEPVRHATAPPANTPIVLAPMTSRWPWASDCVTTSAARSAGARSTTTRETHGGKLARRGRGPAALIAAVTSAQPTMSATLELMAPPAPAIGRPGRRRSPPAPGRPAARSG